MKSSRTLDVLIAIGFFAFIAAGVVVIVFMMRGRSRPPRPTRLSHWTRSIASSHSVAVTPIIVHAGVLEFRIAPTLPTSPGGSKRDTELSETEHEKYLNQLAKEGPLPGRNRGDEYLWFPIHAKGADLDPDLVVGERAGRKHILLYNQPGYTMLNDPAGKSWAFSASITRDMFGKPAVGIHLDKRGSKMIGLLTGAHNGHFMAILVGDEVYSAPIIKATVYDQSIITGDFTPTDVEALIRTLETDALPSHVGP